MRKNSILKVTMVFVFAVVMLLLFAQPKVAVASVQKNNNYPIVLVHGFAGWGNDEMLGYNYWGGFADLERIMSNTGLKTYAVAVGPFSSNWDRACELYAYIVGGTVDYGKAHSEKNGHARYGKTYPGVYPEWGKTVAGKINKIHLVGHSMGGQTARTLVQLLEQGSQEEKNATPSGLSPLFSGGNSWVHSVTSIATPHDGTTIADQSKLMDIAKGLLSAVGAMAGIGNGALYDFKLEQWGLKKSSQESYSKYAERVWKSSIWSGTKDFSTWDLCTDGAAALNTWVKAQPNVYYFSWATCSTNKALLSDKHLPDLNMTIVFYPTAMLMGSYTRKTANRPVINNKWFPNDGVVNTISQNGPKNNSSDLIVNYTGKAQAGKWNYMGLLDNTDHINSVGHLKNMNNFYKSLVTQLYALPA